MIDILLRDIVSQRPSIKSLERMWPAGNRYLVKGLRSPFDSVRDSAWLFLVRLSYRDARYVSEAIDASNVESLLLLLERLDRYWYTLAVRNENFQLVVEAYILEKEILEDPECDIAYLESALDRLATIGGLAVRTLPKLDKLEHHTDPWIRQRAGVAFRCIRNALIVAGRGRRSPGIEKNAK